MRELEEALRDWERYQRIQEEQFLQDRDTQNMVHQCHAATHPVGMTGESDLGPGQLSKITQIWGFLPMPSILNCHISESGPGMIWLFSPAPPPLRLLWVTAGS